MAIEDETEATAKPVDDAIAEAEADVTAELAGEYRECSEALANLVIGFPPEIRVGVLVGAIAAFTTDIPLHRIISLLSAARGLISEKSAADKPEGNDHE